MIYPPGSVLCPVDGAKTGAGKALALDGYIPSEAHLGFEFESQWQR